MNKETNQHANAILALVNEQTQRINMLADALREAAAAAKTANNAIMVAANIELEKYRESIIDRESEAETERDKERDSQDKF
jgi:predicted  nucleic acid-binding Zn-ribbon protein